MMVYKIQVIGPNGNTILEKYIESKYESVEEVCLYEKSVEELKREAKSMGLGFYVKQMVH